jgi:hypothetical protein
LSTHNTVVNKTDYKNNQQTLILTWLGHSIHTAFDQHPATEKNMQVNSVSANIQKGLKMYTYNKGFIIWQNESDDYSNGYIHHSQKPISE